MTTPDPTDVHTGTDRVDPRDDPTIRAAWGEWNRNTPESFWDVAVLPRRQDGGIEPSIMWPVSLDVANRFEIWAHGFAAASVPSLTAERNVLSIECVELEQERDASRAEIDRLKVRLNDATVERDANDYEHQMATRFWKEAQAERDAARAELAAANARCAELEHLEHERKGFAESWAKQVAKAAALQATLDRVGAFIETWSQPHSCAKNNTAQCVPCRMLRDLRAALRKPRGLDSRGRSILNPNYGIDDEGGEAMSTADDAWQEWLDSQPRTFADYDHARKAGFMAGYRRALEDAAAEIAAAANPDQVWQIADTIRNRAAGVGTKDGDDDE